MNRMCTLSQEYAELMEIEKSARGLLVEAIQHERCLRVIEEACHFNAAGNMNRMCTLSQEYADQQRELFRCLSLLSSVANVNRKGREDLGPEVFEVAATAK